MSAKQTRGTRTPRSASPPLREDSAEDVGPGVEDHPRLEAPTPPGERPENRSEDRDGDHVPQPLIPVRHAEDHRLDRHGGEGASGQRLELPLEITAEDRFLA